MYFNIKNINGELVGSNSFGDIKFRARRVIIDSTVEIYPFKDKILVKTPKSYYIEKELFLCVWRIDRRPGTHVEISTYQCRKSMLYISD
jgi:hypothetical protein